MLNTYLEIVYNTYNLKCTNIVNIFVILEVYVNNKYV